MKLNNKTYDFWKRVAQYYLPAIATCIATIFKIWNFKRKKLYICSVLFRWYTVAEIES